MTYIPQPHFRARAARIKVPGSAPAAVIGSNHGCRISGKLQTISVTGGLLHLPKPLDEGSLVEVMFLTHVGPVLGKAEMLPRTLFSVRCLQAFRFLRLDDLDFRRLRAAIESYIAPNDIASGSGRAMGPGTR